MAYTTINKSTDYFNTKLYTGNASTQAITGVGFQPDWLWIKNRVTTNAHNIFDAVRGINKKLDSANNTAENTSATNLTSFDSDGFTLASNVGTNGSGNNLVSWNWKAGTTSGITTNGSTTITPTAYSFNATAGFSIIKYTGNGTTGAKYPHGLGVAPKMVIVKNLGTTDWWNVHHASLGNNSELYLNTTDAAPGSTGNGTTPDSVNIELEGTGNAHNGSGNNYIAYCFAEKTGYSKFGKYTGNNSDDGTFIYTGFKPKFVMVKNTHDATNWSITDDFRDGYNTTGNKILYANTNGTEDSSYAPIDHLSNGFKIRLNTEGYNGNGGDYIYMAFGQSLVGSNNVPCNAR